MKTRPGRGFLKSHTPCVAYITHLGDRSSGLGEWWDVVRGGARFLVQSVGWLVGVHGGVVHQNEE